MNIKNKHLKKSIKLLLIIILVFWIFNYYVQNVSTTSTDKIEITYAKSVAKETYTVLKKEIPKIEQPVEQLDQDIINKENSNNNETTRSQDINEREIVVNNSITIPHVCTNALLSIGSTQKDVDNNDICIMTDICKANFGDGKAVLLGGHNNRSLKYLYNSSINDVITVCYNNNFYNYKIIYSSECSSDGHALYDIKTKESMLDFTLEQEILYIYTCYNDNNWLVKAIVI